MKIFTNKFKNRKIIKKNDVILNAVPRKTWRSNFKTAKIILSVVVPIATMIGVFVNISMQYGNNKKIFHTLWDDYNSWYYADEQWTGLFNNYPEGYVDMASFYLSDSTLQIAISTHHGVIDGVATEKGFCKMGLPTDFKLVSGKLSMFGNSGEIIIYDYVGGFKKEYARFNLKVNYPVMEVVAKSGVKFVDGKPIRLAMHPDMGFEKGVESLSGSCAEEAKILSDSRWRRLHSLDN